MTKNWAGGVAQGEGPEFKPQYCKNKTKQSKQTKTQTILCSLVCNAAELCSWDRDPVVRKVSKAYSGPIILAATRGHCGAI
jgi:hypothetical protein